MPAQSKGHLVHSRSVLPPRGLLGSGLRNRTEGRRPQVHLESGMKLTVSSVAPDQPPHSFCPQGVATAARLGAGLHLTNLSLWLSLLPLVSELQIAGDGNASGLPTKQKGWR